MAEHAFTDLFEIIGNEMVFDGVGVEDVKKRVVVKCWGEHISTGH